MVASIWGYGVSLLVEDVWRGVWVFFYRQLGYCLAREYSGQEMSVGLDGNHERVSVRIGKCLVVCPLSSLV